MKKLFYLLVIHFLGNSIYKDLKFLMNSQWWSVDELKEYQMKKIKSIN